MKQELIEDQHSPAKSVLLHLLPGALIGLGYFALLPVFHQWGYPSLMALSTAILLILVPFELGYLYYQSKQKNGRFSLQGIVQYRKPIPLLQYFIWVPVLFIIIGAIFTLMKPVDSFLQNKLFAWLPMLESGMEGGFSKDVLIATYGMLLVVGAVVGPTVEEFYFRGYLLPRMKLTGRWAPILHTFLFALYHVWTPWMFVTRTIAMLPLVFAVQRRNLNTGIFAHIIINLVDVVVGVGFIMGMTG